MDSVTENWKAVKGYEGKYEVSDLGRVQSLDRMTTTNRGTRCRKGSVLKTCIHPKGYVTTSFANRNHLIHRIVAEAFIGAAPSSTFYVRHINRIRSDNRPANLEYRQFARRPFREPSVSKRIKSTREELTGLGLDVRAIPQHDGYFAANDGSIWSCRVNGPGSCLTNTLHKMHGSPHIRSGHMRVKLRSTTLTQVHQLVAITFFGVVPEGMEVRHLNGDPTDNRIENLKYGTRKENIRDGVEHGTVDPKFLPREFRKECV